MERGRHIKRTVTSRCHRTSAARLIRIWARELFRARWKHREALGSEDDFLSGSATSEKARRTEQQFKRTTRRYRNWTWEWTGGRQKQGVFRRGCTDQRKSTIRRFHRLQRIEIASR